jgi:hypothetical protein
VQKVAGWGGRIVLLKLSKSDSHHFITRYGAKIMRPCGTCMRLAG